ncbi:MAG: amino acid-binding protein [Candidatus Limnocylindrales bacterium]
MKLQQLSLFLENKPGSLRAPCEALAAAGIDLLTVSLADTAQFGILRFIVRNPEHARQVLQDAGMIAKLTEVVPVEVENRPGGLARVLAAIEAAGLGVEYMYDFGAASRGGKTAIVFRFEDPDAALAALGAASVRVLTSEEVLGQ